MLNHNPLLILALAAVLVYVVTSILIMRALDRRNIPTNLLLVKLLIFKYVHQYKEITTQETGKPGPLFPIWVVSINLAAALGILGWITCAS